MPVEFLSDEAFNISEIEGEILNREGLSGFKSGLTAENYIRITGTSRATATRDLHDLAEKQALVRTGTLKSTRYHLPITVN